MRSAVRLIAALGLILLGAAGLAADDLVAVPPLKARVTDLTATLSRDQSASLEADLAQFEKNGGSQIAILLVPTTKPETIEAYSIRVAEAWKIGRKGIDDGIILIVARNDRKLRIEVGRGLEGAVPDAIAKRIVAEVIGPRFKEGDFYGGLKAGVAKLEAIIGGEALPLPRGTSQASSDGSGMDAETLFVVGLVIATMLGGVMGRLLGRLGGSTVTSGVVGGLAWLVTGSAVAALIGAIVVFIYVLAIASSGRGGGWSSGGWGGGGWSGGSSGGGFSGGGGGFGGGGASGDW